MCPDNVRYRMSELCLCQVWFAGGKGESMHLKLAFGNQEKTGSTIMMNSVNVFQCSNMKLKYWLWVSFRLLKLRSVFTVATLSSNFFQYRYSYSMYKMQNWFAATEELYVISFIEINPL